MSSSYRRKPHAQLEFGTRIYAPSGAASAHRFSHHLDWTPADSAAGPRRSVPLPHGTHAGFLYQAHLRWELSQSLGVKWPSASRGMAEMAGVPKAVPRAFPQRRIEIEEAMTEAAESTPAAAQVAKLATRPSKDRSVNGDTLRSAWSDRAAMMGFQTRAHPRARDGGVRNDDPVAAARGRDPRRPHLSTRWQTSITSEAMWNTTSGKT